MRVGRLPSATVLAAGLLIVGCAPATQSATATSPSPARSADPTPEPTVTATPTPTPTPTPSAAVLDSAQAADAIQRCVVLTESSFAGDLGDTLTYRTGEAVVGVRPTDGFVGIYIPVTDTTPELAFHDLAATCILDLDSDATGGYGGTTVWSQEEIAQLLAGTGPGFYLGGD